MCPIASFSFVGSELEQILPREDVPIFVGVPLVIVKTNTIMSCTMKKITVTFLRLNSHDISGHLVA